jgi:site-specific DNA recombinase
MKEIKYILYARKSTESDDRQVQSIESQVEDMKEIANRKGLNIVKVIEESKSAKAPFKRPGFNEMVEMIEDQKANGILTWSINRLSRNPAESGLIQQLLQDEKIMRIQTHSGSYDPDDNAVILSVESSVSNQFIRDLRKAVKRGISKKARDGGIGGPAPQGYLNNTKDKSIIIDPVRFPIIRSAYDMYFQGYSIKAIVKAMNDKGYRTVDRPPRGSNPMSTSTLYSIFNNPRYAGRIPDPYEPGIMHVGDYKPMITPEEYDRVQILLGDKGRARLCESQKFILKGLLRCGECGCMITASRKKKTLVNGTVNEHVYYHCTRKRPCSQRLNYRESELISLVDQLLEQYDIPPQLREWGLRALDSIAQSEIKQRDSIKTLQFQTINELQNQLDNLIQMASKGLITTEQFEKNSSPLKLELKVKENEQLEANQRSRNWYEFVGELLNKLGDAGSRFSKGDLSTKNNILQAIGRNPVLIDGKLEITPYNWVIPIKNGLEQYRLLNDKVRTESQQIENDENLGVYKSWYPELDSNQRP